MLDYAQLTHIDEGNLQAGWLSQPGHYMEAVKAECDAKRQVSELEEKLSVLEATTTSMLRENNKDTKPAPTETFYKQAVAQWPEVQAVKSELREAEYQKDMMHGLREALDHRASALRDLVQMAVKNLRAEPTLSGITRQDVEDVMTSIRQKANPIQSPRAVRK